MVEIDMWLRGNLHTHTTNSDGDASPDVVAAWYRDHGYDFLSLTDHNKLTPPESVGRQSLGDMFLIAGEEITMPRGVHVNAINITREIPPPAPLWRSAASEVVALVRRRIASGDRQSALKVRLIQAALASIHAQGGLASVNHPNFRWALDGAILGSISGLRFFEVFNAHPVCFSDGDSLHPSSERMWDGLLSAGRRVYGLATDDEHDMMHWGPQYANPGRGWVVVNAADRSPTAVQQALEGGSFYASTGVRLSELTSRPECIELAIDGAEGEAYETSFIADGGRVVGGGSGTVASCTRPAAASYLRATVRSSSGARAWVQPVFAG